MRAAKSRAISWRRSVNLALDRELKALQITIPRHMSGSTPLADFLGDPMNSTSRERLLAHRLIYELKLASARAGVDLRVYEPDVDRDGFDLVLESEDALRKVQTKVVQQDAATNSWCIHKGFLRPDPWFSEHHGLHPTVAGAGMNGAILVMNLAYPRDELQVTYWYFDMFVLTARELTLIPSGAANEKKILPFLGELSADPLRGRISVPSWMFVPVKDTDALLALLGMYSLRDRNWQHILRNAAACYRRLPDAQGEYQEWHRAAEEEISSLTLL